MVADRLYTPKLHFFFPLFCYGGSKRTRLTFPLFFYSTESRDAAEMELREVIEATFCAQA